MQEQEILVVRHVKFSDEYCKYGEFTGTMVGITCADRVKHKHYADFDFLEYVAKEDSPVE